jgi:hypothetical protein
VGGSVPTAAAAAAGAAEGVDGAECEVCVRGAMDLGVVLRLHGRRGLVVILRCGEKPEGARLGYDFDDGALGCIGTG